MRERLNKDPKAQIALVAVLVAAAAFLLLGKSGGGESSEETPSTEATVSVAGTGASGTATGATPGEAVEGAVEEAASAAAAEVPPVPPSGVDAPPLPAPVMSAYKANKTVVLLIVHNGGIDDRLVTRSVRSLSSLSDVAYFVVPASQVARYAAITLGVEVSRVPALVVMRPRNLSKGKPQASVSYGYLSTQSVVQAVNDASYHGPGETYYPQ